MPAKKPKLLNFVGKSEIVDSVFEDLARPRASSAMDLRIGRRIRKARTERNLSLSDLAAMAKIAPQQLQKYETARTRVSASRLYQLAQVLGRPVFWFFEET